jgi:hypothetical protein
VQLDHRQVSGALDESFTNFDFSSEHFSLSR